MLTVTGSVATALISDKRSRMNQHREAHLASGAEALNALQQLNRQLINVAREPEPDKPNAGNEFGMISTRLQHDGIRRATYSPLLLARGARPPCRARRRDRQVAGARNEQIMAQPRISPTSTASRRIGSELSAGGSDCVRPIRRHHPEPLGVGCQSSGGISANKQGALRSPCDHCRHPAPRTAECCIQVNPISIPTIYTASVVACRPACRRRILCFRFPFASGQEMTVNIKGGLHLTAGGRAGELAGQSR